jgi:hypothetical protein
MSKLLIANHLTIYVASYELLSNIFVVGGKCPPNGKGNTHHVASMCAPSIVG